MLATSFQYPDTVIMLNCKIRTSFVLFLVSILWCFIGKVSAQTIDDIISSAANSSERPFLNRNGSLTVELDMLFTKEQWSEIQRLKETTSRKKRKAIRDTGYRWNYNEVPYYIHGYFSAHDKQQIKWAVDEWNYYTCLTFRPAGNRDWNKIRMQNGHGCSSYVGMQGGTQLVTLAPNCRVKRVIVHELGHAIGFQHEQTRPDRDSHVDILQQNIQRGTQFNFETYSNGSVNSYGVPYDYTSIMHYGATAFSYNGRPTIKTKDALYQNIIGRAPGLSFKDIKLANLMYDCGSRCGGKKCPSSGFFDKNCVCICPGPSPQQPTQKCSGGGGGGKDCVDRNQNCKYWATKGECKKNPAYMLVNCKKSCNKCGGGGDGGDENKGDCVDKNTQCAAWARRGECNKNPDYMHINCKKSCKKCKVVNNIPCFDFHNDCPKWNSSGFCTNPVYKSYMITNCPQSCDTCG